MDVEPVLPIEDEAAIAREESILNQTATACSHACGLRHTIKKPVYMGRRRINLSMDESDDDVDSDDSDDDDDDKDLLSLKEKILMKDKTKEKR